MKDLRLTPYYCFVESRDTGESSEAWWTLIDPTSGDPYAQTPIAGPNMVEAAVQSAQRAFQSWRSHAAADRSNRLHALAEQLRQNEVELTAILSREVGKPLAAARGEVLSAAQLIDYFAQQSMRMEGYIPLLGHPRQKALIVREPVGVVVAITPYNYPLSTLVCKMAPALAVGCTVIAKPDEHTPLSSIKLAHLAAEVGFPPGVFNVVTGTGPKTGNLLVNHPVPRLIAFTGSTGVGKQIQAACAPWVRKSIMELGGQCPAIICADAPWENLLPQMVAQVFKNSGQYCYRISRILVQEPIYEGFLAKFTRRAATLTVGPPNDPQADLGPLNNQQILDAVRRQVDDAVRHGARLELGGQRLTEPSYERGFYYPPTVLSGLRTDMAVLQEEIFGPVALIQPFTTIPDAIREANASRYGLAAYLFTNNAGDGLAWAEQLESGSVWVNQIHQAYPEAPFGGMKESGLGREKSRFGIEEYTELKTIYLSY